MRSLAFALALAAGAIAQDAPPHGVRIEFLPPPLDGTLSVGARYELHVSKVAARLTAPTSAEDFVFRFVAGPAAEVGRLHQPPEREAPLAFGVTPQRCGYNMVVQVASDLRREVQKHRPVVERAVPRVP